MTTFLDDEIGRVPGESVIPTDTAAILAVNPAWTLAGDVWETVTTEDVTVLDWGTPTPVTPRMGYVLTIDVHASADARLRWLIHETYYDGGTLTLADGAANIDPVTLVPAGAWTATARAWDAPEGIVSGAFVTEVTAPPGTLIKLRTPFAAPLDEPLVVRQVVAGNPNGARVVLAGDALTAYDSTGTETARITGEGGEFVGGEFRTSDVLPGQVTMADDAYTSSVTRAVHPGIRVDPIDPAGIDIAPGIGPFTNGIRVDGGRSTGGSRAHMEASPGQTDMYSRDGQGFATWVSASARAGIVRTDDPDGNYGLVQTSPVFSMVRTAGADGSMSSVEALRTIAGLLVSAPDGSKGEVNVTPTRSRIRVRDAAGSTLSEVYTDPDQAYLFTRAGGASRYLTVDAAGVWVQTNRNGTWEHYNLEQTATMPAPELLPYAVSTGWDTQHSPLGSVLVTHSTTGRHCQSRVRFNRRGADFSLTTTNSSIGQVIPSGARHSISMVDYIPITLPGGVAGELVADYRYGHVYLRTLTGTAVMRDGDYVYATLSWFIPN